MVGEDLEISLNLVISVCRLYGNQHSYWEEESMIAMRKAVVSIYRQVADMIIHNIFD